MQFSCLALTAKGRPAQAALISSKHIYILYTHKKYIWQGSTKKCLMVKKTFHAGNIPRKKRMAG
uniref:Uncharacterized protein n=1 Tax=Arion vulgaris TaxID=1028688 RepID=A0A0B7AQC0_9EUPU